MMGMVIMMVWDNDGNNRINITDIMIIIGT